MTHPDSLPPLPLAILTMLVTLFEHGSAGDLDVRGRVLAGTPKRPLQGAPEDWLRLVAYGYLGGERNTLILTEEGRARAEAALATRTRVAAHV